MGDILKTIKRRLYNNIIPSGYYTPFKRVWNAVVKNIPEEFDDPVWGHTKRVPNQSNSENSHLLTNYDDGNEYAFDKELENDIRNALWAKYLGLTDEQVGYKISDYIEESPYRPPHAKEGEIYYRINPKKYPLINDGNSLVHIAPKKMKILNPYKDRSPRIMQWFMPDSIEVAQYPKGTFGQDITITRLKDLPEGYLGLDGGFGMGKYTVGKGEDENGEYVSYHDVWDLNPFKGSSSHAHIPGLSSVEDISVIGTPVKLYDRVYSTPAEKKKIGGQIKPNFLQRLEDPNRKSILDWASKPTWRNNYTYDISTHKMGYEYAPDDTGRAIVFPEVQEVNGKLVDFTRPPYHSWAGYNSALDRGDYLMTKDLEEARKWVEGYKDRYKNLK